MITKHFLRDHEQFVQERGTYWQNTDYHTYLVSEPLRYPCVAIELSESQRALGTVSVIEEFVYLSDFGA